MLAEIIKQVCVRLRGSSQAGPALRELPESGLEYKGLLRHGGDGVWVANQPYKSNVFAGRRMVHLEPLVNY